MAEKKPNILECDGIIIRGPNGKARASIRVYADEGEEGAVWFDLNGKDTTEPALSFICDADGRAQIVIGYAGIEDGADADDVTILPGISIDGGAPDALPRFQVFGRGPGRHNDPVFEIPEKSDDGRRADFIRALVEAGEPYRDLGSVVIADALEDASEELCDGGVVSVARAKHWREDSDEAKP